MSILFRHNRIPKQLEDDGNDLGPFYIGPRQKPEETLRIPPQNDQGHRDWTLRSSDGPGIWGRRKRPSGRFLNSLAKRLAAVLIGLLSMVFILLMLLRWAPVPTSAFMLRQKLHGRATAYHWVDGARISPNIAIAVVAAEDQRFPDHLGFDFKAILEAMKENHWRSRPRGASTISQQVAKNLFLWPGRSLLRKGLEAGLTAAIELCWPKRRILEIYLNIAQFGPDTFGVAAASQRFFHKAPDRLTPYESALLAAVLPNPENYSLVPPSPYVWQRAADIQEQIRLLGGPAYLKGIFY